VNKAFHLSIQEFITQIYNNNSEKVKQLLGAYPSIINTSFNINREPFTPLKFSIRTKSREITKLLIQNDAHIEQTQLLLENSDELNFLKDILSELFLEEISNPSIDLKKIRSWIESGIKIPTSISEETMHQLSTLASSLLSNEFKKDTLDFDFIQKLLESGIKIKLSSDEISPLLQKSNVSEIFELLLSSDHLNISKNQSDNPEWTEFISNFFSDKMEFISLEETRKLFDLGVDPSHQVISGIESPRLFSMDEDETTQSHMVSLHEKARELGRQDIIELMSDLLPNAPTENLEDFIQNISLKSKYEIFKCFSLENDEGKQRLINTPGLLEQLLPTHSDDLLKWFERNQPKFTTPIYQLMSPTNLKNLCQQKALKNYLKLEGNFQFRTDEEKENIKLLLKFNQNSFHINTHIVQSSQLSIEDKLYLCQHLNDASHLLMIVSNASETDKIAALEYIKSTPIQIQLSKLQNMNLNHYDFNNIFPFISPQDYQNKFITSRIEGLTSKNQLKWISGLNFKKGSLLFQLRNEVLNHQNQYTKEQISAAFNLLQLSISTNRKLEDYSQYITQLKDSSLTDTAVNLKNFGWGLIYLLTAFIVPILLFCLQKNLWVSNDTTISLIGNQIYSQECLSRNLTFDF
jgi:hypothetical protein